MSLALLKTAIVEQGVQRLSHSGIPTYGAQKGQPRWRYAVVGEEGGDRILRLSTGDKIMQWRLNSAEDATRIEDLADEKLEDGQIHASGAAQVHKSSPSLIHATMQDGRIGSTFSLTKQQGDNWKVQHKPGKEPLQNTALQFVQAFKEKTAALTKEQSALEKLKRHLKGFDYHVVLTTPGGDGASMHRATGESTAVRSAREAHKAWEKTQGIDTEHDWAKSASVQSSDQHTHSGVLNKRAELGKVMSECPVCGKIFDTGMLSDNPEKVRDKKCPKCKGESKLERTLDEKTKDMGKVAIIEKIDGEYILWTKDRSKRLGTHKTRLGAIKQEYAIQKSQESESKLAHLSKYAQEIITYVPTSALDSVRTHGLLSGDELAKPENRTLLSLARPFSDGDGAEGWLKRREETKKSQPWNESYHGTSAMFGEPDSDKIHERHPTKRFASSPVRIRLGELLKKHPKTKLHGSELIPFEDRYDTMSEKDKDRFVHARHHDLTPKEISDLIAKAQNPKEMWKHYDDPEGKTYAGNVPHVHVITPTGRIDPEFLDFGDAPATSKLASLVTRAGQVARYMARVPQNEPFVSGVAGTAKNIFRLGYKPYMGKHTGKVQAGLTGGVIAVGGHQLYGAAKDIRGKMIDNANQIGATGNLVADPNVVTASDYMRETADNPIKIVFPRLSESFRKLPENIQPAVKQTNRDITLISIRDFLYNMGSKSKNNAMKLGLNVLSPIRPLQIGVVNSAAKVFGAPAGDQIKNKMKALIEKYMTQKPEQKTGNLNDLTESEYVGMKIKPRIEVITPRAIVPNQVSKLALLKEASLVTAATSKLANDSGKRFKKVITNPDTGRERTVEYGQAGKASDGGDRIRPGTSKGDAYCARSAKIKGDWASDPNSPNRLSRRKWKCRGSKSVVKSANAEAAIPEATERSETAGGKASVKVRNWLNTQLKAGNKIERYTAALKNMGKKNLDPEIDNDLTQLLYESGVEDAPLSFEGQVYDDFWQDFNEAYIAPLDTEPVKVNASPSGAQKLSIFHKKAKLDSPKCKTPNLNKLADFTFNDFTSPLTDPNPIKATATAAVVGAGLGAGLHYYQKLKRLLSGEEEPENEPSLLGHIGRGAAAGAGTSLLWRGVNESMGGQKKRASLNRSEIIARIMSDYSLSDHERSLLIAMAEEASQSGLSLSPAALSNAGLGALAGWIASKMGGFGNAGQLVGAGLGAGIGAMFTNPSSAEYYRGYTTY